MKINVRNRLEILNRNASSTFDRVVIASINV